MLVWFFLFGLVFLYFHYNMSDPKTPFLLSLLLSNNSTNQIIKFKESLLFFFSLKTNSFYSNEIQWVLTPYHDLS